MCGRYDEQPMRPFALFASLAFAATSALAGLQQEIGSAITAAGYQARVVSVAVLDCDSGSLVAGIASSTPRIPASNQKLLTSGLAARELGRDFQFQTQLLQRGNDLIVAGDGDPALGDEVLLADMRLPDGSKLTATGLLDIWANAAKEAGVTHVDSLIVDDRVFDRDWRAAGWPTDQLQWWYCAPLSGLNFSCNTITFRIKPGDGRVAVHSSPPWGGARVVNKLKSAKSGHVVHAAHDQLRGEIELKGKIVKDATLELCVESPPTSFGLMLADRLTRVGITVDRVRLAAAEDPPPAGTPVAPAIVTSLETVMRRCNHDSYNLYADAMLKRIAHERTGRPGSWKEGSRILTRAVELVTGTDTGLQIADGGGMSRLNSISARTMTQWLCSFDSSNANDAFFINSISRPGEGKLAKRFKSVDLHGAEVRAKTGYIRDVYTMSGYVTCNDGKRYAFSILINGARGNRNPKSLQERIVAIIAAQGC